MESQEYATTSNLLQLKCMLVWAKTSYEQRRINLNQHDSAVTSLKLNFLIDFFAVSFWAKFSNRLVITRASVCTIYIYPYLYKKRVLKIERKGHSHWVLPHMAHHSVIVSTRQSRRQSVIFAHKQIWLPIIQSTKSYDAQGSATQRITLHWITTYPHTFHGIEFKALHMAFGLLQ